MLFLAFMFADFTWCLAADWRLRSARVGWAWRVGNVALSAAAAAYGRVIIRRPWYFHHPTNANPFIANGLLVLHAAGYFWHIVVLPVALPILLLSAAAGVIRRFARLHGMPRPGDSQAMEGAVTAGAATEGAPGAGVTRRAVLGAMAAAAVPPLAAVGLGGVAAAQAGRFRVRRADLSLATLPADLDGLTIAHVSDLHLGKFTRPGSPERLADAINALNADLICFTGDLIDYAIADLPAGIDFLRRLVPRHGRTCLAMIEGNHDLIDDLDRFEKKVLDAGLPLLLDEAVVRRIPGRSTAIRIAGISWGGPLEGKANHLRGVDYHDRRSITDLAVGRSVQRLPPPRAGEFPIVLTHHPHTFDPIAAAGWPLTLCGHTHGGQVMLTDHLGAGPCVFRYWSGAYQKGESQLFISNGLGAWFPLRVNAPAEVGLLTFRKART